MPFRYFSKVVSLLSISLLTCQTTNSQLTANEDSKNLYELVLNTTQGPQGRRGATGATGPRGPAGTSGATGQRGPIGPSGTKGVTGASGPKGVT
ncbi:MAG TPA: hypothetical protein VN457_01145, partial [Chlamydiales bacterium]|nr:hypothetical protein [Chlamydiales bacterium]